MDWCLFSCYWICLHQKLMFMILCDNEETKIRIDPLIVLKDGMVQSYTAGCLTEKRYRCKNGSENRRREYVKTDAV